MDDIFYDSLEEHNPYPANLDLNVSDVFNRAPMPPAVADLRREQQIKNEEIDDRQAFEKEELACNGNNKNKYINRINAIMKEGKICEVSNKAAELIKLTGGKLLSKTPVAMSQAEHQEESSSGHPKEDKLEKNRRSAKMSRERKKFYMEMLETKVSDLQKEINKTKEQLDSTNNYLQKVVAQNQTVLRILQQMSSFAVGRQQTMKRLQKLVENGNNPADISEINSILDSLRTRIGATGRQRVNTINEYFKQIVNISFPALHRYMMWTASERKHLFSETSCQHEEDEWFKELDQKLGLTEQQKRQILSRRDEFEDQKNVLLALIDNLHETKKKIEVKSEQLENQIDKIRTILTPVQCAKFILFIEKNKYRKELNIWDKKRQREVKVELVEDTPQKRRKVE